MSCPICGKEGDPKYRPFCSRRCADVDLAHWLRGNYSVPAVEEVPEDDAGADPEGAAPGSSGGFPDKLH